MKTVLFVFPHQDDEMFIFHRIRHLIREGARTFFVWVTDGAANDPEVRRMIFIRLFLPILARERDEDIRRIRAGESRALMRSIGVPDGHLRFLSFPSGRIRESFPGIVGALSALFGDLRPDEIYTVAYEHGEFEHDACNAAVRFAARAASSGARLFEWPVFTIDRWRLRFHWFAPRGGERIERTRFNGEEERERLRLFREMFPSQWFVASIERATSALSPGYRGAGEPYRKMSEYDYLKRIPGRRILYQPRSVTFDDFREMVSGYLPAPDEDGSMRRLRGAARCES